MVVSVAESGQVRRSVCGKSWLRTMTCMRGEWSGSILCSLPVRPPPPTMINQCTPPAMLTSLQKLLVVSPCSPLISSSFLSQARPDLVMEESIIPLSRSPPPCQTGSSPSPASHKLDFVQTISGHSYPCRPMSWCRWSSNRTRSRKSQWCIPHLFALSPNHLDLVVFQLLADEHHPDLKLCYLPSSPSLCSFPSSSSCFCGLGGNACLPTEGHVQPGPLRTQPPRSTSGLCQAT